MFVRLLSIVMGFVGCAAAAQDSLDWWTIDNGVARRLLTDDLGAWAKEIEGRPTPDDPADLLTAFDVLSRAGHGESRDALVSVIAAKRAAFDSHVLAEAADFLIRRGELDAARSFIERFPETRPGLALSLLQDWAERVSFDEVDRWLIARAESHPDQWFQVRLSMHASRGTATALVNGIGDQVRARPGDGDLVRLYIDAVERAGASGFDLSWLPEVVNVAGAYDAYDLGVRLKHFAPGVAAAFLERAIALPFTESDRARIADHRNSFAIRPPDMAEFELQLRANMRVALIEALHAAGDSTRAHALLDELSKEHPDGLPPDHLAFLAGEIQAATGARQIERRVNAAGSENPDEPEYWLTRAEYFAGRGETEEAMRAFEEALTRAGDDPEQRRAILFRQFWQISVLISPARAAELAREEVERTPLDSPHARMMAQQWWEYARQARSDIDPQDALLWSYLRARSQWEFTEERSLWLMAEAAAARGAAAENELWTKAEAIANAEGAHGSISKAIGWVMTRCDERARAIPLLTRAARTLDDGHERNSARFAVFETHLALGDWRSAERAWPDAAAHLTPSELPDWLGQVALAAAKVGDHADAIRLWSRVANLDRLALDDLEDLTRAGLRDDLIAFYEAMAADDPDSVAPARAIARLRPEEGRISSCRDAFAAMPTAA